MFTVFHQHPLAKKKEVNFEDIHDEKILLLDEEHCFSEQSMELCARAHLKPMDFRASSLETVRHMVAINLGCTLMPALATQTPHPLLKYIPFADPSPSRDLVFAFRKTHVRVELFKAMAKWIGGLRVSG